MTLPTELELPLVVVVDDDRDLRSLIAEYLRRHSVQVLEADGGPALDALLRDHQPDAIILDLMMPGEDGLSICRRLSTANAPPILMLTAMGEETDRIVGLELGADDYLPKPCNPRELLARLRAILRRTKDQGSMREAGSVAVGSGETIYEFANWRLYMGRRELIAPDGQSIGLTSGEFALLRCFVERPMRVLSRDQLLDLARGRDALAYDRAIDVQISRLRSKMTLDDRDPGVIRTIRNEGYVFSVPVTRRGQ